MALQRQLIVDNVITTLRGITIENGYSLDVQKVMEIPTSAFEITEFPTLMVADIGEDDAEGQSGALTICLLHLLIPFWSNQWTDVGAGARDIASSIKKILAVDRKRGGLAYHTLILGDELYVSGDLLPYGGGSVRVDIYYRHMMGDPYTQG